MNTAALSNKFFYPHRGSAVLIKAVAQNATAFIRAAYIALPSSRDPQRTPKHASGLVRRAPCLKEFLGQRYHGLIGRRTTVRLTIIACIGLMVLSMSPSLHAADSGISGFNTQIFRPAVDGSGIYNIYGSFVPEHLRFNTAFFINYASKPTKINIPAIPLSTYVEDKCLVGDFQFSLGMYDLAVAGIDLPVYFYEEGQSFPGLATYRTTALGDLRFDVKFRLLKDKHLTPGVALLSSASFPTGNRDKFTGDKNVGWEGRLIVDKSFHSFTMFANAGYRFMPATDVNVTGLGVATSAFNDDRFTFGAGSRVILPWNDRRWSLLGEFWGETVVKNIGWQTTPMEMRGGIQRDFKNGMRISIGGGAGLTDAYGAPEYRVFANVGFDSERRAKERKKPIAQTARISGAVNFAVNKTEIAGEGERLIHQIAADAEICNAALVVSGHTDSAGPADYNMRLSKLRAEKVRDVLVSAGMDAVAIDVEWYGETKPTSPNTTREGKAANRRVEIETR